MERKKILIAEDDQFLRELYADVLGQEKNKIDLATDGEEALQKMQVGGYDLVLLDIIMPKISGIDIMNKIQSQTTQQPNKCVVFLTNLDKDEEIKKALKLGDGYLIKSQITPGKLVEEVEKYLNQK